MRKVQLREVVLFAQGHIAGEWVAGLFPLPECVHPRTESSVALCPLPDRLGQAPAEVAFALWMQGGKSGSSSSGPGRWDLRQAGWQGS